MKVILLIVVPVLLGEYIVGCGFITVFFPSTKDLGLLGSGTQRQ